MKKIGLICLAVVLAVGALGIGFAHWSQTLFIEGTVETGELIVGIRDNGVNDPGLDPGFDRVKSEQVYYDKDVASITSTNVDEKCKHTNPAINNGVETQYYHKEVITITNAYPSYAPGWTTLFANAGTIPVKLESYNLDPVLADWPAWIELIKWEKTHYNTDGTIKHTANGTSQGIAGYTPYTPGPDCFDAMIAALMGQQLEPCEVIELYVELHITQFWVEVPMDTTFTFTADVTFTQWNLVP